MATDTPLQIGMVGLGRMGAGLVRRLMRDGHSCVVYDVNPDAVAALVTEGATGADSYADLAVKLEGPRTVWIMVPAGEITESTVTGVAEHLSAGDAIIDGGNSYYRDDIRRAGELAGRGIHYLDVGTSGGVFGLERGFCLMIGGDKSAVERLAPVWQTISPGVETAPLREPQYYRYDFDLAAITELWRRGSVVSSWLLDLTAAALHESPQLEEFSGRVSDSGEGRWTAIAAIEEGVPAPVLTAALYQRFSSRGNATYGDKVLSAMRKQFGGHHEKKD